MDAPDTPILSPSPPLYLEARRTGVRWASLIALCIGVTLLVEDLYRSRGFAALLVAKPNAAAQLITRGITASLVAAAVAVNPATAEPSLLESLNAPYKSGAEQLRQQQAATGGTTTVTRRGSKVQTDPAEELRKSFLGEPEAPPPGPAKPAPRGLFGQPKPKVTENAPEKPKVAEKAKPETAKQPPRPLVEGIPIPRRPTTLPKLEDKATTQAPPPAAPAKVAPKTAPAPAAPKKAEKVETAKKVGPPKKVEEAKKKVEPAQKVEDAKKKVEPPKAVATKPPVKVEPPKPVAKQEPKKKDEGGNPFLGPLLVLGALYGLGATSEEEEGSKGGEDKKDQPPENPV